MTGPVRLAGHGRRRDGAAVIWTLAEGAKGRRWREVVRLDGQVRHAVLFETGPDRRFTHLELASSAGLATLHPDGDGTLHGNVVGSDGVRHVVGLGYPADATVVISGSPITGAALAWSRLAGLDLGIVVELDPLTLDLTERPAAPDDAVGIDVDGAPQLDEGRIWPLEV